jgi:hypothetical protein
MVGIDIVFVKRLVELTQDLKIIYFDFCNKNLFLGQTFNHEK